MASEVSALSNENNISQNHSINSNNDNPNPFANTYNLAHGTNGTNLLLSASMPSLVAAAVAGITTFHQNNQSLLPVNQIQSGKDTNSTKTSTIKKNTSSGLSPTASSPSSPGTSSPVTTESSQDLNSSQNQSTLTNNSRLLDLIKCKLSTSFHMLNDPRLLECGATACLQCILHRKDSENKLNCPCCSNIHFIPSNANKLDQKIQNQKTSIVNFDQYLQLVQNDVLLKVDTMKAYLDICAEQFTDNLKLIRKEVQKQWVDHSSALKTLVNDRSFVAPIAQPLQNSLLSHQNPHPLLFRQELHNQQIQQAIKENPIQFNGSLKQDSLVQLNANPNVLTLLESAPFQLKHSIHDPRALLPKMSLVNSHQQSFLSESQNTTPISSNESLNLSNSSSWSANDDNLDDFEPETRAIKPTSMNCIKRHLNKEQAQFNKFVRNEVSKKFGEDFLLKHEVNQLESSAMELIKSKAIASYLPKETSATRAWTLAKVSLRSLKRDLRRKQAKIHSGSIKAELANYHPFYNAP